MRPGRILRIQLVTPAPPRSRAGNRVTATRWARLLRGLGHRVRITTCLDPRPTDVLVALHARRSAAAVAEFVSAHPDVPVVVVLTGTDLYQDLPRSAAAQNSLALATRLVVLQSEALRSIPRRHRLKSRVIVQSATRVSPRRRTCEQQDGRYFRICIMGHLRAVKDPFLLVEALRLLPSESRVRVTHLGAAIEPGMADRAHREMEADPRYRWVGERPRWSALRTLARSDLSVLTSRLEGGANVVSEAIAAGVPVLATRIPGSVGLLGQDYPGYYPVGNARRLAHCVQRFEPDPPFRLELQDWMRRLEPLVDPRRERRAWVQLLAELA